VVWVNCGLSAEEQIEKCPTWEDLVQLTRTDEYKSVTKIRVGIRGVVQKGLISLDK
jgi:hypothetical protein